MSTIPGLVDVKTYLGSDISWSDAEIVIALAAQAGDQAKKARVPASRKVTVTTTTGSPALTGAAGTFTASDVGSEVTGAGMVGAPIVSVNADGSSATASVNANTSGSSSVTVAVPWPESLRQALCRRTQVALSLQPLPLAVQVTLSDVNAAQVRVGSPSQDPLVRDLERPYRKLVVG